MKNLTIGNIKGTKEFFEKLVALTLKQDINNSRVNFRSSNITTMSIVWRINHIQEYINPCYCSMEIVRGINGHNTIAVKEFSLGNRDMETLERIHEGKLLREIEAQTLGQILSRSYKLTPVYDGTVYNLEKINSLIYKR